jgi:hypothetical protein
MKEVSQYDGNLKTLDGKSKALNQVTSKLAGKCVLCCELDRDEIRVVQRKKVIVEAKDRY